jgi:hypothetical protein
MPERKILGSTSLKNVNNRSTIHKSCLEKQNKKGTKEMKMKN